METVGPRYRTLAGISVQVALSIGYMMNAAVAYFIRDVLFLQMAVMAPIVVFIPLALYVCLLHAIGLHPSQMKH